VVSDQHEQDDIARMADKLKKMIAEVQEHYETLIDSAQLYKKGSLNDKEFLFKLGEYLKSMSSINFLASQIVLGLKSVFEGSKHSLSGSSLFTESDSKIDHGRQALARPNSIALSGNTTIKQSEPKFKPVTITLEKPNQGRNEALVAVRKCHNCGNSLTSRAKYCNKCGSSQ
jgi:hypothetical protein